MHDDDGNEGEQLDALGACTALATAQGRRERQGPALALVGEDEVENPQGKLVANVDGLNLYASPIIDGEDREALERTALYLSLAPAVCDRPVPRRQTHRLFGVLGANSKIRARIVPKATHRRKRCHDGNFRPASRQSIPWADLLKRTFQIDAVKCPKCALTMCVVGVVKDIDEAKRLAGHLGADCDARIRGPPIAAA